MFALSVALANPPAVYAGTSSGFFKSVDGGAWNFLDFGSDRRFSVFSIAIDPRAMETVYAGTYDSSVLRTTDGGASWAFIEGSTNAAGGLVVDPRDPTTLYAAALDRGLWAGPAAGGDWEPKSDEIVRALAIDPMDPDILYAGTPNQGILRSVDRGESWNPVGPSFPFGARALAVDQHHPQTLYTGTSSGSVYKSTDGGATWALVYSDRHGAPSEVTALVVDSRDSDVVYAATLGDGLVRTKDGGQSWMRGDPGLPSSQLNLYSVAIDVQNPEIVLIGSAIDGVFRSTDYGESWETTNGLSTTPVFALAVDPVQPTVVYAGTSERGVFKSTDGGRSWTGGAPGIPSVGYVAAIAVDPRDSRNVYAAGPGVFKSADGGASWMLKANLTGSALWIDPEYSNILYVGTLDRGVFKSTDSAETWAELNSGLSDLQIHDLVAGPDAPRILLAATNECGINAYEDLASASGCPGDCNQGGGVTIDELVRAVNIALGTTGSESCLAVDLNEDGAVTVDELVKAVRAALEGCPPRQVESPTPTGTPTVAFTLQPTVTPSATQVIPPTPTHRPTGSILGEHVFNIAAPSAFGSGFFATLFGNRNAALEISSAALILVGGALDSQGVAPLRLRDDVTYGVRLDTGTILCVRLYAAESSGEIDCDGGSAYDVHVEQTGGADAPPATITVGSGDDAGPGAGFLRLPVAIQLLSGSSLSACELAQFPTPEQGVLTSARVTAIKGARSIDNQGHPFDCDTWETTGGPAALVAGGTAYDPTFQLDLATVLRLAEVPLAMSPRQETPQRTFAELDELTNGAFHSEREERRTERPR